MKVSIVIPTFNRPGLLKRLLKSIRAQTFRDYEVIVVDDGSEDRGAYESLNREFKRKIKSFRYLRTEGRRGAPHSRNLGIRAARYPLVALVDDDDEWFKEKLRKQVEVFRKRWKEVDFVYTWAVAVDEKGRVRHRYDKSVEGDAVDSILRHNFVPSPSPLIKRECLLKAGLFDETLPSCQDWDMWIRIFARGYRSAVVPEILCLYHKHAVTIGNNPRAYEGYLRTAWKHFGLFLTHRPLTLLKMVWAAIRLRVRG